MTGGRSQPHRKAEWQEIILFEVNEETSELAPLAQYALDEEEGGFLCPWTGTQRLAASPDGAHLYLLSVQAKTWSSEYVASITVYKRDVTTGLLTKGETIVRPNIEEYGWGPRGKIAVSAGGENVYANISGILLVVYSRDTATGELETVQDVLLSDHLASGPDFALSPDGASLYVPDHDSPWSQLAVYSRDDATGTLEWVQGLDEGDGGLEGLGLPTAVDVSPDGRFVYVASPPVISWFERLDSGNEVVVGGFYDGPEESGHYLGFPADVKISPDGKFAYAADGSGCPTVFSRAPETGVLMPADPVPCNDLQLSCYLEECPGGTPSSLAFSPDGNNLYGVTWWGGGLDGPVLTVYAVDSNDGTLDVIQADWGGACAEVDQDWQCGDSADQAIVSPDLANVYLTLPELGAIQVFTRDLESGQVVESELILEGEAGVPADSIWGELVFSKGGDHLYSAGSDSITVFARDSSDGSLMHVQTVDLLPIPLEPASGHAYGFGFSPAGDQFFALTKYGVSFYFRDKSTGALQLDEHAMIWDGYWTHNLAMALSPDSDLMFVTSRHLQRLQVLELCGSPPP